MYVNVNHKRIFIHKADHFKKRLIGLMGKKEPLTDGLWFPKCRSIHMFFMKQSIDVIMTTRDHHICYLKANLQPWQIILPQKKAFHTYEMPLHTSQYLKLGEVFKIKE